MTSAGGWIDPVDGGGLVGVVVGGMVGVVVGGTVGMVVGGAGFVVGGIVGGTVSGTAGAALPVELTESTGALAGLRDSDVAMLTWVSLPPDCGAGVSSRRRSVRTPAAVIARTAPVTSTARRPSTGTSVASGVAGRV